MLQGEVNTLTLDETAPAQIQVFDAIDRTGTGNGMFAYVPPPPLNRSSVLRMIRLTNLNDVANEFDQGLVINVAQVGTAREAEGRDLCAESMINGVVECRRDERGGLVAVQQRAKR